MKPGTSFGKYELVSRLAQGGMAETFRARMTGEAGVTKQVVIKKMIAQLAEDEAFTAAFISEARLTARFNHPNIAQIFDFGQQDGEYFLAMELIEGRSLAEVLARAKEKGMAKLPEPIACYLAVEVLKALHYAHTREGDDGQPLNVVHRDVSPDNVLVSFEGDIKVVDFGLAKAALHGRRETQAGMVKGKFLYFSPEQAEAEELDARSDLFAVGILLYRMVCGVLPFEGQMQVAVTKILTGDYRPPQQLNPALSPALGQIMIQALQRRRDERFDTALQMQEALSAELFRVEHAFSSETLKEFIGWLFAGELQKVGAPSPSSKRLKGVLARSARQLAPVTTPAPPEPKPAAPPRRGGIPTALKVAVAIVGALAGIAVARWSIDEPKAPAGRPMLTPGPLPIAAPVLAAPVRGPAAPATAIVQPVTVRRLYALPAEARLDREHRVHFDPQFIFDAVPRKELRFERGRRARVSPSLNALVGAIALREAGPQYVPVGLGGALRFKTPTRLIVAAPVLDAVPAWEGAPLPGRKPRKILPALRRLEEHEGLGMGGLDRSHTYRVELTTAQKGLLLLAVGKPEPRIGLNELQILSDGAWRQSAQVWAVPSRHDVSGVTALWFGILSIANDPELTLSILDLGPRPGAGEDPQLKYPLAPVPVDLLKAPRGR